MTPLFVALAGGLGAVTRFVVDAEIGRRVTKWGIPLGTALINVSGSFLLGLIVGWWTFHTGDPGLKAVLGTGFMGGYTTFSTACVEAARLARADRRWTLLVHAGGTLVLGVAGAALGFWLGSVLP
ncbi:MAG: camphor resistance protein CrcB [Actinobacteria bacterium HGW-Actinobacteria-5]|jgi:CrcB protein|nr:MAG: camphor resistance protein CrcB [Actinobacteria bacterium HGW-Actinobacteria-5]